MSSRLNLEIYDNKNKVFEIIPNNYSRFNKTFSDENVLLNLFNIKKTVSKLIEKDIKILKSFKLIKNKINILLKKDFKFLTCEVDQILDLKIKAKNNIKYLYGLILGVILLYIIGFIHNILQNTFLGNYDEFLIPLAILGLIIFFIPKWGRTKFSKIKISSSKDSKKSIILKLLMFFIVLGFCIIYLGKSFFVDGYENYFYLYIYGVSITLAHIIIFYGAFYIYEDPGLLAKQIEDNMEKKGIEPKKPLVSCMIAVFNEEVVLETCINSILGQSYENMEIIFVNDCSTDKTKEILDKYVSKGLIKAIHLKTNQGKKRALGAAIRIAKGSIFAMSDSDSVWEKDVIKIITRIFNQFPKVGGVSGHGRALNPNDSFFTKIQDPWYEGQFSIRKAFESIFGAITCVSGPLAVFRKETIYNYIPAWENDTFLGAPFKFATDRTLTGYVLGSTTLGKSLKKNYKNCDFKYNWKYKDKDWDIVYCKSARSKTVVPDTFRRIIKQHARWKKSFIRNMFLTGAFYWKKHPIAAILYYVHIIFVLVGPLVAARHLLYLPAQGDIFSPIIYLMGIFFVGAIFGLAFKIEDRKSTLWRYRPFMSLFSTLILSWLIIYSLFTLKKMTWSRD